MQLCLLHELLLSAIMLFFGIAIDPSHTSCVWDYFLIYFLQTCILWLYLIQKLSWYLVKCQKGKFEDIVKYWNQCVFCNEDMVSPLPTRKYSSEYHSKQLKLKRKVNPFVLACHCHKLKQILMRFNDLVILSSSFNINFGCINCSTGREEWSSERENNSKRRQGKNGTTVEIYSHSISRAYTWSSSCISCCFR